MDVVNYLSGLHRLLLIGSLSSLVLAGCAATQQVPGSQAVSAGTSEETGGLIADAANQADLNQSLLDVASRQSAENSDDAIYEYRVGPDDVLEIAVFDVEELNLKARVSGRGSIIVPLLGSVDVGGKTADEVERSLTERLGRDFIHNPQVSVFISEYRSQEIAVSGQVEKPAVFYTNKPRTVLQLLAMAGGLTDTASQIVNVQTSIQNPESKQFVPSSLIIDIRDLVAEPKLQQLTLRGGDSIFVPQAGTIFVEGAVENPGSYPLQGEVNVLKAIALAGGVTYDAVESAIQVVRNGRGKKPDIIEVDLNSVRERKELDLALADGDVVLVKSDTVTKGVAVFWQGLRGILSFGVGL